MRITISRLGAAFAAIFYCSVALAQTSGSNTNHAFIVGKGAGTTGYTSLLCGSAQIAVGQSAADPICQTLTGDVTISAGGVTAVGTAKVVTAMLALNNVTNATLAQMANGTIKCRTTAGTGNPEDCTAAQVRTILALVIGTNVQAWDADLDCVAALAGTGIIRRTGAGTCSNGTAVANSELATMAAYTLKGNATGSAAVPTDIDVTALTAKGAPVAADIVLIQDSAASFAMKKATVGSVASAGAVSSINGQTGVILSTSTPQGRLTVSSAVCAPSTDQVAQTTLYYAPCGGWTVPIYDGTNIATKAFVSSASDTVGLSLALGSNWAANTLYDGFVGLNGGTVTLCTGPAWTGSGIGTSTRGTGAGTTQLALIDGIWTNAVSMTCRYNNTTTFTCAVNQCTHLGTVLTGASAGTIDLKFGTAASGGGAAVLSICNMYNRADVRASVSDTSASWAYNSANWRAANNATTQVTAVSCMGDVGINATYSNYVSPSTTGVEPYVGIGLNSTTALAARASGPTIVTNAATLTSGLNDILSASGRNVITAIEWSAGSTTFSTQVPGFNQQILMLSTRM